MTCYFFFFEGSNDLLLFFVDRTICTCFESPNWSSQSENWKALYSLCCRPPSPRHETKKTRGSPIADYMMRLARSCSCFSKLSSIAVPCSMLLLLYIYIYMYCGLWDHPYPVLAFKARQHSAPVVCDLVLQSFEGVRTRQFELAI